MSINILEKITEIKCEKAFFTSYLVDLFYFEKKILGNPNYQDFKDITLIVDSIGYNNSLIENNFVYRVGLDYQLCKAFSNNYFHAKVFFIYNKDAMRLIISSSNLTLNGIGKNLEIAEVFDFGTENCESSNIFVGFIKFLQNILNFNVIQDVALKQKVKSIISDISRNLKNKKNDNKNVYFIDSFDISILEKIRRLISEEIDEINIISPYFGDSEMVIEKMLKIFSPRLIRFYLNNEKTSLKLPPRGIGCKIKIKILKNKRFIHGKVLLFRTKSNTSYILTGSANFSLKALLCEYPKGNVEAMILRKGSSKQFDYIFNSFNSISINPKRIIYEPLTFPDSEGPKISLIKAEFKNNHIEFEMTVADSLISKITEKIAIYAEIKFKQRNFQTSRKNIILKNKMSIIFGMPQDFWNYRGLPARGRLVLECAADKRYFSDELWIHNPLLLSQSHEIRELQTHLWNIETGRGNLNDYIQLLNFVSIKLVSFIRGLTEEAIYNKVGIKSVIVKKELVSEQEKEWNIEDLIISVSPVTFKFKGRFGNYHGDLLKSAISLLTYQFYYSGIEQQPTKYTHKKMSEKDFISIEKEESDILDEQKLLSEFESKIAEMRKSIIQITTDQSINFSREDKLYALLEFCRIYIIVAKYFYYKIINRPSEFYECISSVLANLFSAERRKNDIADGLLVRIKRQGFDTCQIINSFERNLAVLFLFYLIYFYIKTGHTLTQNEKLVGKAVLLGIEETVGINPFNIQDFFGKFESFEREYIEKEKINLTDLSNLYSEIWKTKTRDDIATEKFAVLFKMQRIDIQLLRGTMNREQLEKERRDLEKIIIKQDLQNEYREYQHLFKKYQSKVIVSVVATTSCLCNQVLPDSILSNLSDPTRLEVCPNCGRLLVGAIVKENG